MKWKSNYINLGTIQSDITVPVIFEADEELPPIVGIKVSCGCSAAKGYNPSTRELHIDFRPEPISIHLQSIGHYNPELNVKVNYVDGTHDTLTFTATVKDKL